MELLQKKENDTIESNFRSFLRGEELGYAYFFHLFYEALVHFATSIVANPSVAEDLATDAMVILYQQRQRIRDPRALAAFLYQVARHASYDYLRKQKVEARYRSSVSHLSMAEDVTVHDLLIRTETLRLLTKAVEELPFAMRGVFRKFYFDGKTVSEIAGELKKSEQTVKNQKTRALDLLRKRFRSLLLFL